MIAPNKLINYIDSKVLERQAQEKRLAAEEAERAQLAEEEAGKFTHQF